MSNDLEKKIDILYNLFSPILNLSDESIQFCNYFHEEESENGIKVLFDLVMDEKLLSILFQNISSPSQKILLFISHYKGPKNLRGIALCRTQFDAPDMSALSHTYMLASF